MEVQCEMGFRPAIDGQNNGISINCHWTSFDRVNALDPWLLRPRPSTQRGGRRSAVRWSDTRIPVKSLS